MEGSRKSTRADLFASRSTARVVVDQESVDQISQGLVLPRALQNPWGTAALLFAFYGSLELVGGACARLGEPRVLPDPFRSASSLTVRHTVGRARA